LVEEMKAADEGEFSALVKMYEGMKPADAAAIFNQLDGKVLVRLARGINPRKMAPIMAKMDATRAQELTVRLADEQAQPDVALGAADLASLPQIVGQ
jgi:flagellar motility protein MotE (MotC chaperone)